MTVVKKFFSIDHYQRFTHFTTKMGVQIKLDSNSNQKQSMQVKRHDEQLKQMRMSLMAAL